MTTARDVLGPYIAGEIPEPWQPTILDAAGAAVDLSDHDVKVNYRVNGGDLVERDAELATDGTDGTLRYVWIEADLAVAGIMRGVIATGNGGTYRPAREFVMRIRTAPATVPDI